MYYSGALLHAVTYTIIQIYALISSFVDEPCDFFPPQCLYLILHMFLVSATCMLVIHRPTVAAVVDTPSPIPIDDSDDEPRDKGTASNPTSYKEKDRRH
ncbi:hypothetical protein Y032_0337g2895 [Ancylostoma ceylanicum]|uniref:Uncharacterized protein n=1 Tax=Ancylostoma ceylanicum TaxID=53326 RepID=A0A016RZA7_9BILA|nr:hypothetical protein Y032_0337g2895 [Ancylostoma ceylanicum]